MLSRQFMPVLKKIEGVINTDFCEKNFFFTKTLSKFDDLTVVKAVDRGSWGQVMMAARKS